MKVPRLRPAFQLPTRFVRPLEEASLNKDRVRKRLGLSLRGSAPAHPAAPPSEYLKPCRQPRSPARGPEANDFPPGRSVGHKVFLILPGDPRDPIAGPNRTPRNVPQAFVNPFPRCSRTGWQSRGRHTPKSPSRPGARRTRAPSLVGPLARYLLLHGTPEEGGPGRVWLRREVAKNFCFEGFDPRTRARQRRGVPPLGTTPRFLMLDERLQRAG